MFTKNTMIYGESKTATHSATIPSPMTTPHKIGAVLFVIATITAVTVATNKPADTKTETAMQSSAASSVSHKEPEKELLHPMAIESLRQREYPGGEFVIEQTLPNGSNFKRYLASYQSEGLKIYGLLTVPEAKKPEGGFPAILFVHGHIPPRMYSTINSYPTYPNYLSRNGFVMFKPDLRGHGNSEGEPSSAHYSHEYVVDALNALAYLKKHSDVNPERIGYWGHSNGGEIGLRAVLVDEDIEAASFWAGVVGSYEDMFETYIEDIPFLRSENRLTEQYGLPSTTPSFWEKIDPYAYLDEIRIPIELQHGSNDKSVPVELSLSLKKALEDAGKRVEYWEYFDDHNIGANSSRAWQRSIDFFHKYL